MSTTVNFSPTGGKGTNGWNTTSLTWAVVRAKTEGQYLPNGGTEATAGNTGTVDLYRAFLPYDTSSIPDDATIIDAYLSLNVTGINGTPTIHLVQSTQVSPTSLDYSDYDQVGTTSASSSYRSGVGAYLLSLASQLGWINKSGYTKLALREEKDLNNVDPFYGKNGAYHSTPLLYVAYSIAPTAPTNLSPAGAASIHTLTPTLSWQHNDPDSDPQSIAQVIVETATGGAVVDSGQMNTSQQSTGIAGGVLSWGTAYRFKVRTGDAYSGWGPYSSWSYFTTNYAPTVPTGLLAEGVTNPGAVQDGTPEFSALYNDPDTGDIAQHYQIQVATDTGFASVVWDSTKTGMTDVLTGNRCPDVVYGGTALAIDGKRYYWRIKFWDDDEVDGAWSATAYFDMDCTVTLTIETDSAGDPSGTPVSNATKTLYLSNISESVSWVQFVFATAPSLTGSTVYHLVLKVVGLDNLVNKKRLIWRYNSTDGYADGIRKTSVDAGSNWTDYSAHDMSFKEYSGATADQTADIDVDYYKTYL